MLPTGCTRKVRTIIKKAPKADAIRTQIYFSVIMYIWRDCLGIEPSGDGTRLPSGFEDRGMHQQHNQPHVLNKIYYGIVLTIFQVEGSGYFDSEIR
ncbi:hypothetical protein BSG1_17020 [Bacillus sp. SG-1]|nr:hypothetical protein BSG1_17020 [Bacillus sp. SG-1]